MDHGFRYTGWSKKRFKDCIRVSTRIINYTQMSKFFKQWYLYEKVNLFHFFKP